MTKFAGSLAMLAEAERSLPQALTHSCNVASLVLDITRGDVPAG